MPGIYRQSKESAALAVQRSRNGRTANSRVQASLDGRDQGAGKTENGSVMTKRKNDRLVVIKEWEPVQCPTCGGIGAIPKDGSAWRTARKRLGLSQRAVAEAMGVSHAYVGELERGTRRMTADVRRRYTDAMLRAREGK